MSCVLLETRGDSWQLTNWARNSLLVTSEVSIVEGEEDKPASPMGGGMGRSTLDPRSQHLLSG